MSSLHLAPDSAFYVRCISDILSGTYSDILSDIHSAIKFHINSDISSGLLSGSCLSGKIPLTFVPKCLLAFFLAFYPAFLVTVFLTFYPTFLQAICLKIYLASACLFT